MNKKSKLKVWVMSYEFQPNIVGGLGIAATHLTRALSKTGVQVTVLCSGKSNRLSVSNPNVNLRILRFPRNSRYYNHSQKSFKASSVMRAVSSMGYIPPDIVHVHSTEFADTAKKARVQFLSPIVYSCHSLASQGINSPSGKNQTKLFRIAKKIIVPSNWQIGAIKKRYPLMVISSAAVIPHGVKPISKKKKGTPNNLLYVGRLIPSKGLEPLIRAIALLSRNHSRGHLTIVGSGKPSYQRKLKTLARKVGVTKRIRWVNRKPYGTVQRMYASYGAVIIPSKTETFCLVALEAMANEVPLISTLSGGLKEFVNKQNAQIIRAVDSASIAQAIKAFWSNPTVSRKRITNARSTAARFRWPAIAKKYKSLFGELKKGSKA
ncbi:glycosyltransferase family 4 protein [Cohnella silvisoli]|uniref:Glycosyltransferase family 4 protein n=1 Tax=Cohnella silvisoli TaxID=2873699 RepID=A0ABV1KYJ2_9BACL|nr:glycosyltransferase family 4 protein [Cohnella silvisoli]MCD9021955.1 glycosyltransferase family 4 protein [Cohnella silvisoli]